MRLFAFFFKIAVILFTTNAAPQSLVRCNNKMVYWVIPDNNCYYTIKIKGDIDLSHQHDILNVNDKALQYILLDKNRYTDEQNNEENILLRYTTGETIYLRSKFKDPSLTPHVEIITLNSGRTAILWYFELPNGRNKEVVAQLFANIIIDDRIFGLGTPIFTGQDLDAAREFVLEVLDTTDIVKNPEVLCYQ